PKPPIPASTSGRRVLRAWGLMRSTRASPSSMSTPESRYVRRLSAIAARTLDSFGRRSQTWFRPHDGPRHFGAGGFAGGSPAGAVASPGRRGAREEGAFEPRFVLGRQPLATMKAVTTVATSASGVKRRMEGPALRTPRYPEPAPGIKS